MFSLATDAFLDLDFDGDSSYSVGFMVKLKAVPAIIFLGVSKAENGVVVEAGLLFLE